MSTNGSDQRPLRILAIDVGAGTQDIFIYESDRTPENCVKLVLPSQTQIVAARVREATEAGRPLHLTGTLMGGGASSDAIRAHLAAGLPVTATPDAARTLHNDLTRVEALGVRLETEPLLGAVTVELKDVDLPALRAALEPFGVTVPDIVAVAVQDHGFRPGSGNNEVRFDYLQSLIARGGSLAGMVYREPPPGMTRMAAVQATIPGAYLMDTGAAAVLGALGDPLVARAAREDGAILVNVGNMHTFATLVKGRRLYGLFEHHTGGITAEIIGDLVERLRRGTLDTATFTRDFDGHGAALDPRYFDEGPFDFVAVTGPNRHLARPLGYHEAAPHGDMMLTGAFGLAEGVLMALGSELTLAAS
ncbi:MAG TPA: DUF1786 domain-containing protein [Thermomicrobiales bacterium]